MGSPFIWEKNGNFEPADQCGIHTMDEPSVPLSSKIQLSSADWNSNQIINPQNKKIIPDDSLFHADSKTNHNKCVSRENTSTTLNSPTIFNSEGLHQKDLSYDDLSKNIDANLAEIDMETFRSEDINSILALPAIYSGNFESASHGEQCASVSGSLLNGLEIDTSVSNRISEDEISICKDEPLFSPQREPAAPERAISVDSLDNSSSYDQDLVLTCKANKNNYTIVFEGSETQFSEDSEYHSGCRSSEGESSASEGIVVNTETSHASSSMIQSDLVFTTWSNLKRAHFWKKRKCHHEISIKSQSLPNLNYPSAFISDKQLWQWSKLRGVNCMTPFYDLEHLQSGGLQVVRNFGYPYSLSLVKLFMKYKVSSRSSVCSSEHSNSTSSLNIHSLKNISRSVTNKIDTKIKASTEFELVCNQNYNIKNQITAENGNATPKKPPLLVDNIRILDWNPACNIAETNNNTINSLQTSDDKVTNNNNNDLREGNTTSPTEECDNSQYFEDSLIEPPVLQIKNFHAMPIKEEEETDISSGDEIMRDSKSNSSSSNIETVVCNSGMIKNNAVDFVANVSKQEGDHNLERINNIFPSCKSNALASGVTSTGTNVDRTGGAVMTDLALENQTQGTQTKHFNSKNLEEFQFSSTDSPKTKSRQVSEQGVRHYSSSSREASPGSSGYVSSRHSSVERLHRSSACYGTDTPPKFAAAANKSIVLLTKTRNCATQVPVHVKDFAMQTSTLGGSHPNVGFLLNDSPNENMPWAMHVKDQSVKRKLEQMSTSAFTKSNKKEDKCIYVCFPNYSLPDLSFLKSVISEDSGSVFLTPTKFKPPQDPLKTSHIRPKSCGGIDACTRKHLSSIKDWESLKVLLPDDLKQLLSDMHLKDGKSDSPVSAEGLTKSKSLHSSSRSSNMGDKSDVSDHLSESAERKHFPRSILRKSSSQHDKKRLSRPWSCCTLGSTCRECNKAFLEMETQSACSCSCQKFTFPENDFIKLYHDTRHVPPSGQAAPNKQNTHDIRVCNTDCASKDYSFLSRPELQPLKDSQTHPCLMHAAEKSLLPGAVPIRASSEKDFGFVDKVASPCCGGGSSHKFFPCNKDIARPGDTVPDVNQFKAMSCDEKVKCKSSNMDFDHPASHGTRVLESQHSSKEGRMNICSDDFFDSEKPPHEFLVSPVQNPQPYSVPPDLYLLQNSLDGSNKLFHESLKRKTGLVENLQKATSIIYDHHVKNSKQSVPCSSSFSIGQKILTSLCPAVHTILSDGLLPSVQGFFGPLPNSPWKVAEASVQLEKSKVEVQELLNRVNSEKLLTDSTYRFNAFIIGLLNLGSLEWWLGHLLSSRSLISHHYHPTALLSLLALPASSHLQQELTELVSPLTSLSFSLDLAFETKMASVDSYGKCTANCCKQNRCPVENHTACEEYPQTKSHFSFHFPHNDVEKNTSNDADMKYHMAMDLLASGKNSRADFKSENQDHHQVWPGITINPFPNAKVGEETSQVLRSGDKKSPNSKPFLKLDCDRSNSCSKERDGGKKLVPEFSLCSSTDSGCSSQAGQSHVLSSVTIDSRESEIHASCKPDGQQFRKLQQKWEKMTHGVEKPFAKKSQQGAQSSDDSSPNHKANKRTPSTPTKKPGKCSVSVKISATPQKRAVSQPPAGKKYPTDQVEVFYERRLQTPDVIASSKVSCHVSEKEKKSRSQIPTLKLGKNLQQKSKIPIQRSGGRTQSANRESRG